MMLDRVLKNSDVIRKASKATLFLQIFAAILLIGLISLLWDLYGKYEVLQDGVRENALWSVFQLDREARRLHEVAHIMESERNVSPDAVKKLAMRYDIVYSRLSILDRANLDLRLKDDPRSAALVSAIRKTVTGEVEWVDSLAAGRPLDMPGLARFEEGLDALTDNTEALLLYSNTKVSTDRAEARSDLVTMQIRSGIITILLAASVAILVVLLRRQLGSVRSAAFAFESMATELRDAYASAEVGNRAKSQFMATMGHEVRTPLHAILGTAELLQLGELPDRVASGLQTIRRSGQSLLEILNEILDFAKLEHGQSDLELRRVVVRDLADSAVEMMRDRALERGNRLCLDCASTLRTPVITTDPTRLRQVLLNLMSNAIKFTEKGTVTLRISDAPGRLDVEISDTGIGIDKIGQQKLFQPFSQVDSSISRKYGGTGLGLTICKEIIESLGGTIGVRSIKGEGSTFWFRLPLLETNDVADETVPAQAPEAERQPLPSLPPLQDLPPLRILLVEDNHVNQQVAAGFLRHLGQSVTVANDGSEAVAAVWRQEFDLVLMDMQMPNMDGIEATRHIRAIGRTTDRLPIVAMTANASENDRKLCMEAGMTGFESKPLSLARLESIVRSAMSHDAPSAQGVAGALEQQAVLRPVDKLRRNRFQARRDEIVEVLGEESFAELIGSFFKDGREIIDELVAATRRGESTDALLHTLKGAAANVGFDDLAAQAEALRGLSPSLAHITVLEEALDRAEQQAGTETGQPAVFATRHGNRFLEVSDAYSAGG